MSERRSPPAAKGSIIASKRQYCSKSVAVMSRRKAAAKSRKNNSTGLDAI